MASPEFISYQINHNQTAINAVGEKVDIVQTDVAEVKTDVGDVENAVGSLGELVANCRSMRYLSASDAVQLESLETITVSCGKSSTRNIIKIRIGNVFGNIRITGQFKTVNKDDVDFEFDIEGVVVASFKCASSDAWNDFSKDITVKQGDIISINADNRDSAGTKTAEMRNLRVRFSVGEVDIASIG